jgi:hypothetical protein
MGKRRLAARRAHGLRHVHRDKGHPILHGHAQCHGARVAVCVRDEQRQMHNDEKSMHVTMGERWRAARKPLGMRHVHGDNEGHTTLHAHAQCHGAARRRLREGRPETNAS